MAYHIPKGLAICQLDTVEASQLFSLKRSFCYATFCIWCYDITFGERRYYWLIILLSPLISDHITYRTLSIYNKIIIIVVRELTLSYAVYTAHSPLFVRFRIRKWRPWSTRGIIHRASVWLKFEMDTDAHPEKSLICAMREIESILGHAWDRLKSDLSHATVWQIAMYRGLDSALSNGYGYILLVSFRYNWVRLLFYC